MSNIENPRIQHLVNEEELQQLNKEAEEMVQKMDSKQTDEFEKILEQFSNLGEKQQQSAGESLEILKRPVKEMMENKNSEIPKTLLALRSQVEELNPKGLRAGGIKGLINKLTGKNPMTGYIRKYQSVSTQIEAIVGSLLSGRDRLQEDSVELSIIKKTAQERIYDLEKQIYLGRKLLEKIDNEQKAGRWKDDPSSVIKAQQKISVRTKNMLIQVNVLEQAIASIDTIIDNNEKLEEAIFNAITMTKNIVTVSAAIQMALTNQKKVINAVDSVNKATEDMLVQNAALLKQNTADVIRQLEKPAIAIDKLRQAFNDVYAAIQMTEDSNKRIIDSSKSFIVEIDKLNTEMKNKISK